MLILKTSSHLKNIFLHFCQHKHKTGFFKGIMVQTTSRLSNPPLYINAYDSSKNKYLKATYYNIFQISEIGQNINTAEAAIKWLIGWPLMLIVLSKITSLKKKKKHPHTE